MIACSKESLPYDTVYIILDKGAHKSWPNWATRIYLGNLGNFTPLDCKLSLIFFKSYQGNTPNTHLSDEWESHNPW